MNRVLILFGMMFFIFCSSHLAAQQDRVIKDVVLLNIEPYEVLMTDQGNIISKLRHLPNYLNSGQQIKGEKVNTRILPKTQKNKAERMLASERISETVIEDRKSTKIKESSVALKDFEDHYEVYFAKGTATLSNQSIAKLNKLAQFLNENPGQKVQLFGFRNEPSMVASLLSKRRQDACIAYLRIKGVNIYDQISKGNVTRGTQNKIVFAIE